MMGSDSMPEPDVLGAMDEIEHDSTLVELVKGDAPEKAASAPLTIVGQAGDFVDFYSLADNPFSDAVNPAYFYKTDLHEETYMRMMLAVRHNISLGMVTGASGTGKTLISQMLLQNMDASFQVPAVILVSPGMSKTALLRAVLSELSLPIPEGPFVATQQLLTLLGDYIIQLHGRGKKLVLLIDECHFLSADSLHVLRTLSNIEVPDRKLVTCLLFAEDRFLKRLEHPSYESLRNRMYLRSELLPLNASECEQYIKYRLLVAGRPEPLFDADALAALHRYSGGICRRINKLCMLALIEGFLRRKQTLNAEVVERCAQQL
jgi:general secretion pathway protein A